MISYIIRRLLLMIPTLIGVTAVVFFIMALAPGGFGGTVLTEAGAMTTGEDAMRIRQYFMRRYGLDQPAYVQYGRWLNQVSPLGFRMAANFELDDDQREQISELLREDDRQWRQTQMRNMLNMVENLAGYQQRDPMAVALELRDALDDPPAGVAMFARIGSEVDPELLERLDLLYTESPRQARDLLLKRLSFDALGLNRVLLNQPIVKMPDLGTSLRDRRVNAQLRETVPITLLLNLITLPVIYIVAILTGIYAAQHRGKLFDNVTGTTLLGLWSVPQMWAGVMLIGFLASREYLPVQLFPTSGLSSLEADAMAFLPIWDESGFQRGWLLDRIWHLILPVICLTYVGFAFLSKLMRGAMLENLMADYVRTARAKGVPERVILFRHVFRNSILPLITVAAAILPSLFVGSFIVEKIFSINGMGRLTLEAAFQKDRELVMGATLIAAILSLLSQIIRDVCYAIADPRVSYE